jgi:hypothetical protein
VPDPFQNEGDRHLFRILKRCLSPYGSNP